MYLRAAALERADRNFFEQSRHRSALFAKESRDLSLRREERPPIFHDPVQTLARQIRRSGLLPECLHARWRTPADRWPLLPTSNLESLPDFRHGPSGSDVKKYATRNRFRAVAPVK